MDVDFRYINSAGVSFHGEMKDTQFSVDKNHTVYAVAEIFGFKKNYQGPQAMLTGIPIAAGHDDHGHLGYGQ